MPLLAGWNDDDLHPQVVEALKVHQIACEEYDRKRTNIDTQYLKALAAAHDGDSEACKDVLAQVAAVRKLY